MHHVLLPALDWGSVAAEREAKDLAPDDATRLATWRRGICKAPKKGTRRRAGQAERLQALARRAEYLWDLVIRRLQLSEAEISRQIDVWQAGDLPRTIDPMPREKVRGHLIAVGTPYWRLKTLMDVWCALWFWPVRHAALLDGGAAIYGQTYNPSGRVPRPVTPLATLDDWIAFAEALLGRADVDENTVLVAKLDDLDSLEAFENELPGVMVMDSEHRLGERFPWLDVAEDIAGDRGFFHWELQFAHIFADGGFDLQLGNPPWVRPTWEEGDVLAEREPWFKLTHKPAVEEWRRRKAVVLDAEDARDFFLDELASQSGMSAFFGSTATYPLLAGTQPDTYRVFMLRTWANTGPHGTVGLLHPDTHFGGDKERQLRAAAYARLRVHADFVNSGNRFFPPPVNRSSHFGMHIYGAPREIGFAHLSWLLHTSALTGSFADDGSGAPPGVRYHGRWDERPHHERIVTIDRTTLAEWRLLTGDVDVPVEEVKLLYPISVAEQDAIVTLGRFEGRLGSFEPRISSGYHEKGAKDAGLIRWELSDPAEWSEVILKGPQLGVATPFFKQPPNTGTKGRPQDLTVLPADALPRSEYRRAADLKTYRGVQDRWGDDRRYTEFYRVAWREMIPSDTDRSLFCALVPPGPAHVHGMRSMALTSGRGTALIAGFWSAMPVDYFLRIAGRTHLDVGNTRTMPAPNPDHPLASALLLRTLRLNCLTDAYADLWAELYEESWRNERWVVDWPGLPPLGDVGPDWTWATPLRTEMARRAALVEIDALVAVWLGLTAEQLATIYRSRFPVLYDYENETWFDADGRKIAGNWNTYGHGQTKEHYAELLAYLDDPDGTPPPDGYRPPFYKADREAEMRQTHAVFTERMKRTERAAVTDG